MRVTISTAHDPAVRLPPSGSYDWAPGPQDLPDHPRLERSPLEARLKAATVEVLTRRGYVLGGDDPTFLVGFRAVVEPIRDPTEVLADGPSGSPWTDGLGGIDGLDRGTLVVRLLDPVTMKPTWVGVCQADVHLDAPEPTRVRRLTYLVGLLFEGIPAGDVDNERHRVEDVTC